MTFRLKIPGDLIGLILVLNHDWELIIANLSGNPGQLMQGLETIKENTCPHL